MPDWHGCRWLLPVARIQRADRWFGTRCQVLVAWLEFVAGISTGAGTGGRAGLLSGPAALPELVRPASPVGQRRCWNGEARAGQRRCWASSGAVPDWRFGRSRVPGRMARVELVAGACVRAGIPKPGPALMLAPGLRSRCPTPGRSALVSLGIGQTGPGHGERAAEPRWSSPRGSRFSPGVSLNRSDGAKAWLEYRGDRADPRAPWSPRASPEEPGPGTQPASQGQKPSSRAQSASGPVAAAPEA